MLRLIMILSLTFALSGCVGAVVGTTVGVATDLAVGAVGVTTSIVGTAVDVIIP